MAPRKLSPDVRERWFEVIFEHAPLGLAIFDREGRFMRVNSRLAQMNGFSVEEHIGQRPEELLPGIEQVRQFMDAMRGAMAQNQPLLDVILTGETPGEPGRKRTWREHFFPIKSEGEVTAMCGIVEELTESLERQTFLAQLTAIQAITSQLSGAQTTQEVAHVVLTRARTSIGAAAGAVGVLDDQKHFEVVASSGYPKATIEKWQHFTIDDNLTMSFAVRSRAPHWVETESQRALSEAGGAGFYSSATLPLVSNDQAIGALTFAFDHFRRFSPQERFFLEAISGQCAQALDRARLFDAVSAALDERDSFLSMISHELRNPVAALLLKTELFSRRLRDNRPIERQELEKLAGTFGTQLKKMRIMLDDFLDIAAMSPDRLVLDKKEVDLANLVRQECEALSTQAEEAGSQIDVVVQKHPVGVWDPTRLSQVVINLLNNAIKYGQGKPVTVTVDCEHDCAIVRVEDRGLGISPEDQKRIFERFTRSEAVASQFQGVGVGLFLVREIVLAHGGRIKVESELGKGSAFVVSLPLGARNR